MQTTLFCHFMNEELLLPSWLKHHKKLFSHGVMLDWGSIDNSADIIREICPNWEIVNFQPHENRYNACSWKIEQLESRFDGWKMALNVSEYLVVDDLEKYLAVFESNNPHGIGFRATGINIVDEPNDHDIQAFRDVDVFFKKRYGYFEYGNTWNNLVRPDGVFEIIPVGAEHCEGWRNRLIHRNVSGMYTVGRHNTRIPVTIRPDIFVAWVGRGSPELYYHKVSEWNKSYDEKGIPRFHAVNLASYGLDFYRKYWENEWKKSVNLYETNPNYQKYLNALYGAKNE